VVAAESVSAAIVFPGQRFGHRWTAWPPSGRVGLVGSRGSRPSRVRQPRTGAVGGSWLAAERPNRIR
jgi:hypothetical protein